MAQNASLEFHGDVATKSTLDSSCAVVTELEKKPSRRSLDIDPPSSIVRRDVGHATASLRSLIPFAFWLPSSLFIVFFSAIAGSPWFLSVGSSSGQGYCGPGGTFDFRRTYNRWASEHVFQITIGFGRLSFTQVKVIDVVWDIVVGRGGQTVLSAVTFTVFSKALNRILEETRTTVSCDTFRALVFEQPSWSSIFKLSKDLGRRCLRPRAYLSIIWFMLASVYIMAFQTMTGAMTGYSSNVDPYFQDSEGQMTNLTGQYFNRAIYLVSHGGSIRGLNLSELYLVGADPFSLSRSTPDYEYFECLESLGQGTMSCQLVFAISRYIDQYGPNPSSGIRSNITIGQTQYIVDPPSLDITIYNTYPIRSLQARGNQHTYPSMGSNTSALTMYAKDDEHQAYTATDLNARGSCNSQPTYMWGFSFLLLFAFSVITEAWALGTYVMWNDAFWNSRLDVAGRSMGFYRGVADVSRALWRDGDGSDGGFIRGPGILDSETSIRESLKLRHKEGKGQGEGGGGVRGISYDEIDRDNLPMSRSSVFRQTWIGSKRGRSVRQRDA